MNTRAACLLAPLFAIAFAPATLPAADPKVEVTEAVTKLGNAANYSWTSTPKTEGTESGRKQGSVEGKTEKGGITHLKSSSGETGYEVAFKGQKIALKISEDWVDPSELPVDDGRLEKRLRALKDPAKEAAELLGKTTDLKMESEGQYSGSLTAESAKTWFSQLGKRAAEATEAKGTVKFWSKDGQLARYEFRVEGKITVGTEKREVSISRTTTVEIKDVGTTKITLPESARSRL